MCRNRVSNVARRNGSAFLTYKPADGRDRAVSVLKKALF